ncbi:glycosyltransferase [Paenibacillus sp. Marseille-Q4541]|uniref:CgeB family protein n=1 Tax=Paenibacillus sp. Marseille-Q4541 TaxID=2831522 RepID=UPI0020189848|nr:glycosyltransferase [Paenibacillus sp. Marseille-Q4541]
MPYTAHPVGQSVPFQRGYEDGYLRGRANYVMNRATESFPIRPVHVLYVSSGKGFPYSPLDEAIRGTLQDMVMTLHVAGPNDSVAEMAASLKPDLVLVLDGMYFPTEQVDAIRNQGIRTAVWLTDDPYYTDMTLNTAPHYDYVFTLELNCIELYQNYGCQEVHYLPFGAYLPQFHPNTFPTQHRRDISFIGSGYWNRINYFSPILPQIMSYQTVFNGIWWDRLPKFEKYKHKIELNRWMNPEETKDVYNGTKIVLNMHRSHEDDSINNNSLKIPAFSPNPRTFEISACATLQLTDARQDLSRFYTPGVEIETYETASEMMDKIEYYLANEDKRREVALRGFERTWKEHSYNNQIHTLLQTIFGS